MMYYKFLRAIVNLCSKLGLGLVHTYLCENCLIPYNYTTYVIKDKYMAMNFKCPKCKRIVKDRINVTIE